MQHQTSTVINAFQFGATSSFIPKNSPQLSIFHIFTPLRTYHDRHPHYHGTTTTTMGLEIKIRIVGRKNGSERWLEDAYDTYHTRLLSSPISVTTVWHKNDAELVKNVNADAGKGHSVVLLDPRGKSGTSEEFAESLWKWLEKGGSRCVFVIGGAEGLPEELRGSGGYERGRGYKGGNGASRSMEMMSLSSLTFTHQFARTLLVEQIYRASEIKKGSGYHK